MLLTISGKIGSKIWQKPLKKLDPSAETRTLIYIIRWRQTYSVHGLREIGRGE